MEQDERCRKVKNREIYCGTTRCELVIVGRLTTLRGLMTSAVGGSLIGQFSYLGDNDDNGDVGGGEGVFYLYKF